MQGSDSGGSLRVPAHNCGSVSLKPTSGRLPLHGQGVDGGLPGMVGVFNSSILMARTVGDLTEVLTRLLLSEEKILQEISNRDPRFIPIKWRPHLLQEKKQLGFWMVVINSIYYCFRRKSQTDVRI